MTTIKLQLDLTYREPDGCPLIGYLLMPFRNLARDSENHESWDFYGDCFERAVIGNSRISGENLDITIRAINYQEQAEGLVDTPDNFKRLVNSLMTRNKEQWDICITIDKLEEAALRRSIKQLQHPNVTWTVTLV